MGVKPVLIYIRTWIWDQDFLRDRAVGNKIAKRLYFAEYQNNESPKKRRKIIQGKKKGKDDKSAGTEGVTYEANGFWTEWYILTKVTIYCNYSYSYIYIYIYLSIYLSISI